MKSFLLQQLARLILPFAILLGLALLLKGHDEPGGGFVAGLSLAAAGILCVTAYGTQRFHEIVPVEPDRVALAGGVVLLVSLLLPLLLGDAGLTHRHGTLDVGGLSWKWHTALLFEIGVVMTVGGGLAAAALWLWETPTRPREEE
ncbi:MAG: MnhB domain-containing protein [Myxococcota bacterium]